MAGMTLHANAGPTRRAVVTGLTSLAALAAAPACAGTTAPASDPDALAAPAVLRDQGAFRRIHLTNPRTGEWLNTVYWADGAYIPGAMRAIDYLLRDWREDEVRRIDPRAIDILAATHALLDCAEPYCVVSGYRTLRTNQMLRRRSRGVARNSYHIKGMAVDVQMKTRAVPLIARAGLALHAGGVGCYRRSQFVHLDCGPVRDWNG